jgi:tetratricopeptide (TPR) repeat protein
MNSARLKSPAISAKRLVRLAVFAVVAAPLLLGGFFWLNSRIPRSAYWKAGLIFLIGIEILYVITAAIIIPAVIMLGALLFARRSGRRVRRKLAHALLLSVSLTVGLVLAEAASALCRARLHRRSAVPAGGLPRDSTLGATALMPDSASVVEAPTVFRDSTDGTEIDIAVLGESSAEGVPYNRWVSIGGILQWELEKALPGRRVRLQILAASGSTLEAQQSYLSRLSNRPEILLIYCGHNEITARIDASRDTHHYFDEELPTASTVIIEQIEAISPVCGLIRETTDKFRVAIPPPRNGNRALIDVPAYTSTEFTALLVDFRRRLEALVAYAEKIGAMPVLISPAGNDAGFEPNRSFLPAATPRYEREAIARDFMAARRKEAADPQGAKAAYQALLARQPGFSEAHYRLAQLLESGGDWDDAYRHYCEARDLDGFPMRCPTAFQSVYHEIADRHGCILVDSQSYFHAVGEHGLLNDHLFHDGLHPSLRGQIALAQAVLHELHARKALGWPTNSPVPLIDPGECVRRFDIRDPVWKYICTWGMMFYDLTYPTRYDSSRRLAKKDAFAQAFDRIEAGESPDSVGLPNIGLPAPVSAASSKEIRGDRGQQASIGN